MPCKKKWGPGKNSQAVKNGAALKSLGEESWRLRPRNGHKDVKVYNCLAIKLITLKKEAVKNGVVLKSLSEKNCEINKGSSQEMATNISLFLHG